MTLLAELARLLRLMDPMPPRILRDAEAAHALLPTTPPATPRPLTDAETAGPAPMPLRSPGSLPLPPAHADGADGHPLPAASAGPASVPIEQAGDVGSVEPAPGGPAGQVGTGCRLHGEPGADGNTAGRPLSGTPEPRLVWAAVDDAGPLPRRRSRRHPGFR